MLNDGRESMSAIPEQEPINDAQFERISSFVKSACGINLHTGKKELVKARLGKRLRTLGIATFKAYMDFVQKDAFGNELAAMLDALATNVTSFFREQRHFDFLAGSLLPGLAARSSQDGRRLRIWSAGCSSGEEPYSIAITVHDAVRDIGRWDAKILATDISNKALKAAISGRYEAQKLEGVPKAAIGRYFTCDGRGDHKVYAVADGLKSMVSFARLNLIERWPMKGPFDVVFCRNVMIYFDKAAQSDMLERFTRLLAPGGVLFIGHSESLAGVSHGLEYVEPTIYRKR